MCPWPSLSWPDVRTCGAEVHSSVWVLLEGLAHVQYPQLPLTGVLLGCCAGLVQSPPPSHSISASCLYCCWIWGSMTKLGLAVGLGPVGSVKTLLNGCQDQQHSPCLTFQTVTPLYSGQAHKHLESLEDLKLCFDTSLTNQDLGNSTSG